MAEESRIFELYDQKLKFRNYVPNDERFKKYVVPPVKPVILKDHVDDFINKAKSFSYFKNELDIKALAPKKADWDFKRLIQDKLDRLDRRTKQKINDLVYDKYKNNDSEFFGVSVDEMREGSKS
ncbi:Coiled-coil domain-containing protein 12 [Thelohanellus kitauei]|uniref:Coiled-coil domain-containing protein 12 n=1 Tax=Thelohanellus kitauei TaxID=669202 RepID=A0A0C2MPW0_THEKT|nr:Coiled-coil domain-containing protein 12 [Thelohanellus kitauei]